MKLRNKKTGEIRDFIIKKDKLQTASSIGGWEYTSLANLCKDWEDYEEPKEYWYISDFGFIFKSVINDKSVKLTIEEMKSIGNYFESREEAEKAVRKLKAWKRLKDKGFRFEGTRTIGKVIDFDIPIEYYRAYWDERSSNEKSLELFNDLNLLFGGEE